MSLNLAAFPRARRVLAGAGLALLLAVPARAADTVFTGSQTASGNLTLPYGDRFLFRDQSSAGSANITSFGKLNFYGFSTAGNATITSWDDTVFYGNSTAGNATIISSGYTLAFTENSNAGNATIVSTGNFLSFSGSSSAANARIDSRYLLSFHDRATGGNATIANSLWVYFLGNSTAGNAALTNTGQSSLVDFSGSAGPNGDGRLSAGSIAGSGEFRLGSRELTVGSNNQFTTVTGKITGTGGSLVKVGSGTLTLAGTNTYTGATTLQSGGLVINGTLSSSVTVNGGVLGGTGTVGGIAANAGGTVAPGNSIGTLTVSGNVSFATGSTYQVEVNAAGQGDRIDASGTATLTGGQVQVLAEQGNYAASTNYTILTAQGGVSGRFGSVTSNLAFLTPSLSYEANSVTLTMSRNGTSFGPGSSGSSVAATRNQGGIARAAEALGAGNAVYNTLLSGTADEARAGFDLLSGEAHAQAVGVAIGESRLIRDSILTRLRAPLLTRTPGSVSAGFSADAPGRAPAATLHAPRFKDRFALWGEAFGAQARQDGDGNAGSLERRSGGLLIGADMKLVDTAAASLRVGAAGGYTTSRFDLDSRLSSGQIDSGHGALYAGAGFGALNISAGAAYAWSETDIRRLVAIRGFSDLLRSSRRGATAQAFADIGYTFAWGGVALEPFAQIALLRVSNSAAVERGGAAALQLFSGDQTLGFATLGLRGEAQIAGTALFARGMLGWRHAFGEITPQALTAFVGGGTAARVYGTRVDRDSIVAEAGLDWRLGASTSVGLAYSAVVGSNARDHALKGRLEVRF